jgi:hypothetical protein
MALHSTHKGCLRALMLTVFHRTTEDAAAKILQGGFRDITSRYLTDREWSGVWVSDRPLDNSEGASGEALLQIDIAEDLLMAFEWVGASVDDLLTRRCPLPRVAPE